MAGIAGCGMFNLQCRKTEVGYFAYEMTGHVLFDAAYGISRRNSVYCIGAYKKPLPY
jgi:hypothetical protein